MNSGKTGNADTTDLISRAYTYRKTQYLYPTLTVCTRLEFR